MTKADRYKALMSVAGQIAAALVADPKCAKPSETAVDIALEVDGEVRAALEISEEEFNEQ